MTDYQLTEVTECNDLLWVIPIFDDYIETRTWDTASASLHKITVIPRGLKVVESSRFWCDKYILHLLSLAFIHVWLSHISVDNCYYRWGNWGYKS